MPTVTFVLGLCGSGKSWLAERIIAPKKFDEGFLNESRQQRELVETLQSDRDAVVVEIGFCQESARRDIAGVLSSIANLEIRWICIENDLAKANKNVLERTGHSGDPSVLLEINRNLSRAYTYPPGAIVLRMWTLDSSEKADVNSGQLVAGRPEHWARFQRERKAFLERHHHLVELSNAVYHRNWVSAEPVDRVMFSLGVLCWEDYEEILLLGANGYGFGSQKILRGMFERAVTASHLHREPNVVDRFIDFGHMSDWKLANELFTTNGAASGISAEMHAEKKRLRDSVKAQFSDAFSWSRLDLVTMARRDEALSRLIGLAYYRPMAETHVSVRALISRTDITDEGATLDNREQKAIEESNQAVQLAHHLTLLVIKTQIDHFSDLGPAKALWDECVKDFVAAWSSVD